MNNNTNQPMNNNMVKPQPMPINNQQPIGNVVTQPMPNNNVQQVNNNITQPAKKENKPKKIKTNFSDKEEKTKSVKMIRYKYKVKDSDGKIIDSYFDAESKTDVESFLLNKAYEIISIEEDKLSTSLGLASIAASRRMSTKDLNFFLMQLSTYVKSGIPLLDSMEILSRQAKKNNSKIQIKC